MPLDERVEHSSVFVDRSPQPMVDTAYNHVHLVQMPPGTPAGFSVTYVLGELTTEMNAPGAHGFAGASLEQ